MKYLPFMLLLALGLFPTQGIANVLGADITWENLGKDTFKATVAVYRDCSKSATINENLLVSTNCSNKTLSLSVQSRKDVTPICDLQCSNCSLSTCSFKYGIQKITMSTIVVTSDYRKNGCCNATISWNDCCRSQSITNGGASQRIHVPIYVDICDTSGTKISWKSDPLLVTCLGRDIRDPSFALESNNTRDSITYEFTDPLLVANSTTPISWTASYRYDKPFFYLGFPRTYTNSVFGIQIDASNGILTARPLKLEIASIAVKAKVYRNGYLFAIFTRDVALNITKCPSNDIPAISGIDCKEPYSTNFDYYACEGEPIDFSVCTGDKDLNDSVTLYIEHQIPTNSISKTNVGSLREGFRVQWIPKPADIRTNPYRITAIAKDNGCLFPVSSIGYFRIHVGTSTDMRIDTSYLQCGKMLFTANELNGITFDRIEWTINGQRIVHSKNGASRTDSLEYAFKKPGPFALKLKAFSGQDCVHYSEMSGSLNRSFLHFKDPMADQTACWKDTISITQEVLQADGAPYMVWNSTDTISGSKSQYQHSIPLQEKYLVVEAYDATCSIKDSALFQPIKPRYVTIPSVLEDCYGYRTWELRPFYHSYHPLDSIVSFTWYHPVSSPLARQDSILKVSDSGYFRLETIDSRGCHYDQIFHSALREERFKLPKDTVVCSGDQIKLRASSQEAGSFIWQIEGVSGHFHQGENTRKDSTTLTSYSDRNVIVTYINTSRASKCSATDTFQIRVNSVPGLKVEYPIYTCPDDSMTLSAHTSNATWTIGNSILQGNSVNVWVGSDQYDKDNPVFVRLSGSFSNGCQKDTAFSVRLKKAPKTYFVTKDTVVKNQVLSISNYSSNADHTKYLWSVGDPAFKTSSVYQPSNFRIDSLGTFPMKLHVHDTLSQCSGNYQRDITVVAGVANGYLRNEASIEVYPNPTRNTLYIQRKESSVASWSLSTLKGQIVKQGNTTSSFTSIAVDDLAEGLYVLQLTGQQRSQVLISIISD